MSRGYAQGAEDDPLRTCRRGGYRTSPPAVALRLRTDSGIEGALGGHGLYGRMTRTLHTAVEELAALTVGEDPMRIEAIVAKLRANSGDAGPGGIFTLALSAIDTALWDIKGKAPDQSLWKPLGGHRDRVHLCVGLAAARAYRQAGAAGGRDAAQEGRLPRHPADRADGLRAHCST